jgi:hypothetical protein
MKGMLRDLVTALIALAACLALLVPAAGAHTGPPVVGGKVPGPPALGIAAAKSAALAKVHRFQRRAPAYAEASFRSCERFGLRHVVCTFVVRSDPSADASTCRLEVDVSGVGHQTEADLTASCRANPRRFLTFHRASVAVRHAGRRLAGTRVAILTVERRSSFKIALPVEWETPKQECTSRFVAQLVAPHDLRVTHTPVSCTGIFHPPPPSG